MAVRTTADRPSAPVEEATRAQQPKRRIFLVVGVLAAMIFATATVVVATRTIPGTGPDVIRIATPGGEVTVRTSELLAGRSMDGLLDRLAEEVYVAPAAGSHELRDGTIAYRSGRDGRELDRPAMALLLERAARGEEGLRLPVSEVPAPVPLAVVVTMDEFRLDVYKGPELRRSYPIGVGRVAYHRHTGAYRIASKDKDPIWWNPGASWSRGMPRFVPPGPRNPLGTRALRLDRDLLAIHGTPDQASVGQRSSRGCFRMKKADVEELYEKIPVGTTVFVFESGPSAEA